jgi:translation initiation factor 1A
VLVAPWEFKSDERGDVVWRYTLAQVDWLKANGYLPQDF